MRQEGPFSDRPQRCGAERDAIMTVTQLLCEQHGKTPLLEIDLVARTYFGLTPEKFLRKISEGDIILPITRMEPDNRKSKKFVAIEDLARYIEQRNKEAKREMASFRR